MEARREPCENPGKLLGCLEHARGILSPHCLLKGPQQLIDLPFRLEDSGAAGLQAKPAALEFLEELVSLEPITFQGSPGNRIQSGLELVQG